MSGWRVSARMRSALAALAMSAATVAPAASPPLRADCDAGAFQTILKPAHANASLPDKAAQAVWLTRSLAQWPEVPAAGRFRLYYSAAAAIRVAPGARVQGADGALTMQVHTGAVPAAAAERFKYVGRGVVLALRAGDRQRLAALLRQQLLLVQEDRKGRVLRATALQSAGALDDLYADAARVDDLGVSPAAGRTAFKLWAPTAQNVAVCLYDSGAAPARALLPMQWNRRTGVWDGAAAADLSGRYYAYLVDVFVPGAGVVRNRVTDPYSISLTTDSKRSYIADLAAAALKPDGWDLAGTPATVEAQTDLVIYEMHVRDFSINDSTVRPAYRGKFLAFTETDSDGMRHLKALAAAGMTDVHLLPVFDLATVPESGCVTPHPSGAPDSEDQQAAVAAVKDRDCFNWGYDPLHYTAPEGSYATDAADGARRIIELRQAVQALHAAGLRVGMDVVYNHTAAAGQHPHSVLDRIVPGYYHRLSPYGAVERSTCCDNTATENLMMGKLMTDSVLVWARQYKIDSFRFDLMGHQPRAVMAALKSRLQSAAGHAIHLIGEGWNFGEVADGARFVQASQLSLNGSGIGTFSDRARDAVRGRGGLHAQGYINGLLYAPHPQAPAATRSDLLRQADLVRVGLAGTLRGYPLQTYRDEVVPLERIDFGGQPAGYALEPAEVVNYVENHDDPTLFDNNVYKLPPATSREDRARVQMLGAAITAFSQGIAYFHAGFDILRSKSMDRNSYDSGDWFNRIDWTYQDNNFGQGLPPRADNGAQWPAIRPLLTDVALKPSASQIEWARDAFRDLLRIRASSTLLRLRTAEDVRARLAFYNTGSTQVPTVLIGQLNGKGYAGAGFDEVLYLINVSDAAQSVTVAALKNKPYVLHPVHLAAGAADRRAASDARYDRHTGTWQVPPRTAVVYVVH